MKRIIPILLILLLLPVFGARAEESNNLILQGDKGEEVVLVQTRLFDLGFYTYKPTGSFQTVTKNAVTAYQLAAGIMSDGSVCQETFGKLFRKSAARIPFHAQVSLRYTAQGSIAYRGSLTSWNTVQGMLVPGESYVIQNASTGEEISLTFVSGEHHADMSLPADFVSQRTAVSMLTKWLGETNSFYKCAVVVQLDGQRIAASIQWNGENTVCVYFADSLSHVLSLPDIEHEANVKKAGY